MDRSALGSTGNVTFKCFLYDMIYLSNDSNTIVSLKNKIVEVFSIKSDQIEGTIHKTKVGSATTDGKGKCNIIYKPTTSEKYQAIAIEKNGQVIAQSNIVMVQL